MPSGEVGEAFLELRRAGGVYAAEVNAAFILLDGQGGGGAGVPNTAARGGLCGTFRLYSPLSAAAYKFLRGQVVQFFSSENNLAAADIAGVYKSTSPVDAFQILFSSGNIASGIVRVYGVAR